MKLSKEVKTRWITVIALLITVVFILSVFPIFPSMRRNAALAEEKESVTYVDTDVEKIVFVQHTKPQNIVFLGFRLETSDYGDCRPWGYSFGGTELDSYLSEMTYWKDFERMNNQGVEFVQQYIYWNGFEVGPIMFEGTVAHRSTLDVLEYGFVINIPAGTTFPSEKYVSDVLAGAENPTPIIYKTTKDIAFYYNGTEFVEFSYSVAESRTAATNELDSVDIDLYYEAEQAQVRELIATAKAGIRQSITQLAVDDVMEDFNKKLANVMTIDDYAHLALKKDEAKAELNQFFMGFSSKDYEAEDWKKILSIQSEGERVIGEISSIKDVEAALIGIKLAANNVLTAEEKVGFAEYVRAAAASLDEVCADEVYRDAEKEQRQKLIDEGKTAIAAATSYSEADGLQLSYTTKIQSLKTQAEWEEEEKNNQNDSSNGANQTDKNEGSVIVETVEDEEEGCSGTIGGYGALFGVMVVASLVMIKKKKSEGERR